MHGTAFVLAALVLACPLLSLPGAGYDALRLPAVLVLAALLLGLLFFRSARGRERPPGPVPLRTAGLLLLAAHLASLPAARTPADAAVPILLLMAGVAVFACLRGGLLRREDAMALIPVVSGVGLIVACLGIGQALTGRQAVAFEGNRNYAGALAAMLLPASAAFSMVGRPWQRGLAAASAGALIALLLLTESRGGLLAALAGLTVAAGAFWIRRSAPGAVHMGIAAVLLVGIFAGFQSRRQLSSERMQTAGFRLEVWKSGLRMLRERPWLGCGAGGFAAEYPPFRSEAEFRYSQQHAGEGFTELEDAHSSWVETAVDTGVPGLLTLLLVAYIAARLWRYYVRSTGDARAASAIAGLGGGAAAYLVAGAFNTLTIHATPTILFWSFLALIEVLGESRPWRPPARAREWKVAIPAAAGIAVLFGAYWASVLGLSDAAFTEGMQSQEPKIREARLREAVEWNPWSWRARKELAVFLQSVRRHRGAVEEGRATLRLHPHQVEALNLTAVSLMLGGEGDREAEAMLKRAIGILPFYFKSHYNLGVMEGRRDHIAEARVCFTESLRHNPAHALSNYYRGATFLAAGDPGGALEDFRRARSLGFDVAGALQAEQPALRSDPRFAEFFR